MPLADHTGTCWFVGLTTLDVVHRAAGRPDRDEKVTASRQDVAAGGPAANAAVTAAALGARAVLVTALGDSPVARAARADLETHGVEVHDVVAPGQDFPLAVSAVLVDEATGERSVVSADAALAEAPPPRFLGDLPHADVVLFDGHHPVIAGAAVGHLENRAPRPLVVLDAGRWRPLFAELLPVADVAAVSARFAVPGHDDVTAGAHDLGARGVVVTHGDGPVEWSSGDETGTVPVPAVEARDTLGAGDAFHGALAVALAGGAALPEACVTAVEVAGTRVRHVGPRSWLAEVRR
ncbi:MULTISPECIES: PfkB family carbohydrate kinase [unclassified Isoptericola]|uniref:PfkB family carbohydrate kinase n=1 Tax=unclassified Isoptericola TaxID=2623355 RepID=UPI0027139725|nr:MULTISPECIES: PfkB family carbohydrate kinase [unclassified Isoptericola]MDO8147167.1 PfkB family carbohydrate kinase [Isoptericola sp. b515]MDO8150517.1 PfkB family carbohydrate kinase [Isoptericola sp. b408]